MCLSNYSQISSRDSLHFSNRSPVSGSARIKWHWEDHWSCCLRGILWVNLRNRRLPSAPVIYHPPVFLLEIPKFPQRPSLRRDWHWTRDQLFEVNALKKDQFERKKMFPLWSLIILFFHCRILSMDSLYIALNREVQGRRTNRSVGRGQSILSTQGSEGQRGSWSIIYFFQIECFTQSICLFGPPRFVPDDLPTLHSSSNGRSFWITKSRLVPFKRSIFIFRFDLWENSSRSPWFTNLSLSPHGSRGTRITLANGMSLPGNK